MKNNYIYRILFFTILISIFFKSTVFASAKNIQSHLAIYEINLKKSRAKDINDASGRLVIEITSTCKGYFQKQRMGLKLNNPNGIQIFSDYNYYAWESINGDKLSFSNKSYLNGKLRENYAGNAVRNSEEISVSFEDNNTQDIKISKEILFPMQYFKDLIESSSKKSKIFEKRIYDGSGPDSIYNAIAIISKSKKTDEDRKYISAFKDLESWWINIAYFSENKEIMIPEYQAEFNLYSNGVISNLTLDYERFVIETSLSKLKYLKTDC